MEMSEKYHSKATLCFVFVMLFLLIGAFFFYMGYDVKTNYYMADNYSSRRSQNAYVGGDAYNYIINGNYFTGYMVLGSAFSGFALLCVMANFQLTLKAQEFELLEAAEKKLVTAASASAQVLNEAEPTATSEENPVEVIPEVAAENDETAPTTES